LNTFIYEKCFNQRENDLSKESGAIQTDDKEEEKENEDEKSEKTRIKTHDSGKTSPT
jgi:hypothetical protein